MHDDYFYPQEQENETFTFLLIPKQLYENPT